MDYQTRWDGMPQRAIALTREAALTLIRCREMPGELEKIRTWFQDYKVPDGKPKNKFGYDNQPQNKEFTLHVVQETHEAYKALKSGKRENNDQLALA